MTDRPSAGARYFKAHGLGNDYLVFGSGNAWQLTAEAVQRVCHPHEGVGSDGIVLQLPARDGVRRLRMFNPDGSEFERSGNGLRIYAAFLAQAGAVGSEPFPVEVGGQTVRLCVHDRSDRDNYDVSVDMGRAALGPDAVQLDSSAVDGSGRIHLETGAVEVTPVSVGNPHCVVFQEDLSDRALESLGPALATHPAFAFGTNVQLAWPADDRSIRLRIWERGVGRTSASGTSSCAVAAAAVARGLAAPGRLSLVMDGGEMEVTVTADLDLTLRGPVQEIATGTLSPGYCAALSEAGQAPGLDESGTHPSQ